MKKKNTDEIIELADPPEGAYTVGYNYDVVLQWIMHAKQYVKDVSTVYMSKRSKQVLMKEALECLNLLEKSFLDSKEILGKVTFQYNHE